jgi:Family of unknown function (DUF5685)
MCGTCLSIRDNFGQAARIGLNRDALILSMLIEQLSAGQAIDRAEAGRCALRGMRKAEVVPPASNAARYAAAVSVMMARTITGDHIEDADHAGRTTRVAFRVLDRAVHTAHGVLPQFGDQFDEIARQVGNEARIHTEPGLGFADYIAPAEKACGLAYQGVAELIGRGDLGDALYRMGAAYGRIVTLIDALEDFEADAEQHAFNLIASSWPTLSRAEQFRAANSEIAGALRSIDESLESLSIDRASVVGRLMTETLSARTRQAAQQAPAASRPKKPVGLAGLITVLPAVLLLKGDVVCCEVDDCSSCCG